MITEDSTWFVNRGKWSDAVMRCMWFYAVLLCTTKISRFTNRSTWSDAWCDAALGVYCCTNKISRFTNRSMLSTGPIRSVHITRCCSSLYKKDQSPAMTVGLQTEAYVPDSNVSIRFPKYRCWGGGAYSYISSIKLKNIGRHDCDDDAHYCRMFGYSFMNHSIVRAMPTWVDVNRTLGRNERSRVLSAVFLCCPSG